MTSSYRTSSDIYPSLTYDDAPAAIDWLCRAFGFTKRLVVPDSEGGVAHSELSHGEGVVMVSSAKPEYAREPGGARDVPRSGVFVADRTRISSARAAGARIRAARRRSRARGYMGEPEGHQWYFANYRPGGHWE
jgi:uncharacterized glyoxalase superfamily protein PhnB